MALSSGRTAFLSSMKSPSWLSSSSPMGVSSGKSAPWRSSSPCEPFPAASGAFRPVPRASVRGRSRAASGAPSAPACLIVSIMWTGIRIVARLVGDRAGDRLTDPPCRVGRELVAAAVFELVHGLHQPDVAFLYKIEGIAGRGSCISWRSRSRDAGSPRPFPFFRLPRLFLALLNLVHDPAEFRDVEGRHTGRPAPCPPATLRPCRATGPSAPASRGRDFSAMRSHQAGSSS